PSQPSSNKRGRPAKAVGTHRCHCGKSFLLSQALQMHQQSHRDQLRCVWPGCEHTGVIKRTMVRHVLQHLDNKGRRGGSRYERRNKVLTIDAEFYIQVVKMN